MSRRIAVPAGKRYGFLICFSISIIDDDRKLAGIQFVVKRITVETDIFYPGFGFDPGDPFVDRDDLFRAAGDPYPPVKKSDDLLSAAGRNIHRIHSSLGPADFGWQ